MQVKCSKYTATLTQGYLFMIWKLYVTVLRMFFVFVLPVRDKKDLPLDNVDHKDQDGSFDYP